MLALVLKFIVSLSTPTYWMNIFSIGLSMDSRGIVKFCK